MTIPRRTPLARGGPIKASQKPLKARGATKAKKAKRYQAYLRSAAWKAKRLACLEAAGGRCQYADVVTWSRDANGVLSAPTYQNRCPATEDLTAHHLTYARWMMELPEDLLCLCRPCHNRLEGLKGRRVS